MDQRWRLLRSATVFETPWVSILKNGYERPDGAVIDDLYVIRRHDYVIIVAGHEGSLVLVREYRAAVGRLDLGLPAGIIEPGETPEFAARRELREETGFIADTVTLLATLQPSPGYIQGTCFVVTCTLSGERVGGGDEHEIAEVMEISRDEVLQLIVRGEITAMPTVAAVLLARQIPTDPR